MPKAVIDVYLSETRTFPSDAVAAVLKWYKAQFKDLVATGDYSSIKMKHLSGSLFELMFVPVESLTLAQVVTEAQYLANTDSSCNQPLRKYGCVGAEVMEASL